MTVTASLTGPYCIMKPNLKFNSANAENMTRQGREVFGSCLFLSPCQTLHIIIKLFFSSTLSHSHQISAGSHLSLIFEQILKQYFLHMSRLLVTDIHTFILCVNNTKQRSIIYQNKLSILARTSVLGHLIHELK